ncbi:hypothetical protein SELMODRAFT_431024 [Selaginella moellendorffii]|uniref:DNA 3'-5' helicase n=1 Tax=Selaginella moellendorffii TaxID=88036 RepID=D8TBA1_SELML|nr:hypothetical protein SELMODRAFT_431024 [Selaginella moellendorffii]
MTFTTAAATEMMDRVAAVVGKEASKELMISMFHSFCLQLCRSHAEKYECDAVQAFAASFSAREGHCGWVGYHQSCCSAKVVRMDNDFGEKTVVMECRNEEAQCTFVVDEILEMASVASDIKPVFANFAILYRQQVTGKIFQSAFRSRKIPFNMHGVAVYCKKVVKDVIALLWTSLGRSGTVFERRVFKALYRGDKTEKRKAVKYVAKNEICSFLEAAEIIFTAKVSGAFSIIDAWPRPCWTIFWMIFPRKLRSRAIPENGRRAKLAEARAKAEAEERQRQLREQAEAEANKALEEAKDAAALANELEEEGKELAKQEAQAVANPQKAKDKAKAAAASLEVLGAKMKDIGASISETSQNGLGGFFKRGTVAAEKEEESQEEEEEVKAKFGLGNLFKRSKATVSLHRKQRKFLLPKRRPQVTIATTASDEDEGSERDEQGPKLERKEEKLLAAMTQSGVRGIERARLWRDGGGVCALKNQPWPLSRLRRFKISLVVAAAATGEEVLIDALVGVGGRRRSASQEQLKHQQHQQVQEYAALLQSCVDGGNLLHRSIVAKDLEQHVSLWNCLVNIKWIESLIREKEAGMEEAGVREEPTSTTTTTQGHSVGAAVHFQRMLLQGLMHNEDFWPCVGIRFHTPCWGRIGALVAAGICCGGLPGDADIMEQDLNVRRNFFVANGDGLLKGVVDNAAENS